MSTFNYIKNIFKVLVWPIIFIVGQFFLVLLFGFGFYIKEFNTIKNANADLDIEKLTILFNEYSTTDSFKENFFGFIDTSLLIITIITFVIFIIIFYKKYKNFQIKYNQKLEIKDILLLVLLGILLNCSYNLIMESINSLYQFTDAYNVTKINFITSIIATGILGPILEEFLFRGLVYNKLKLFNKKMTAIVLTSIIFALFHQNFIQVLYTFCLSFILIYVYEKYKTLKAPIIVHIASNIINVFVCLLIFQKNLFLNIIVLMLSLVGLILINSKFIKKDIV